MSTITRSRRALRAARRTTRVAEIGTVAAVLCALRVDDVDLTEPLPADTAPPPFCSGIVLAPWPNRVRAGRWQLDGVEQQLDITEPKRGGALHGLLEFAEYEVRERTDATITLGAIIHPQHGWPFLLDTWIRYEVTADGLTVTHGARNLSERLARRTRRVRTRILRIGAHDVADLVLTVPAAEYLEVDERLDPIAGAPVEGTGTDLRDGRARRRPRPRHRVRRRSRPVDGVDARRSPPPTARASTCGRTPTGATCRCSRPRSSRRRTASARPSRSSR